MAANTLKFGSLSVLGVFTPSLTLDYIEEGTSVPLPSSLKVWAGNITFDGADVVASKYENIPITLALKVTGASKAALDTALRALVAEIVKPNVLEFAPDGGTAIYYETYPYDAAEAQAVWSRAMREAFMAYSFTITLQAKPFAVTAPETISVVENLLPNWSFEDFTGDDPDDYTVTETAGAGAAVVTHEDTDIVFGSHSLDLSTTSDTSVAKVETTAKIAVNNDLHYNIVFNYMCEVGTLDKLTCVIRQFKLDGDDPADWIDDDITITPTVTATDLWYYSSTVIHPHGAGGTDWHADTTYVKIYFCLTGAAANPTQYYVDGAVFTCSEYLSGNELSNALGIVLPSTALAGDVPSPCDIYLSKFADNIDTVATYVGGRKEYSASYVPELAATTGTAAYSNIANKGSLRTIAIPANLVVNGDFELNDGASPTCNFNNWAEVRGGNYIWNSASCHTGTGAVYSVFQTGAGDNTLTSDAMVINSANDYEYDMWYTNHANPSTSTVTVRIYCFTDAACTVPTVPAYLTAFNSSAEATSYTFASYAIPAASWPVDGGANPTIRAKIYLKHNCAGLGALARFDDVALLQTSNAISFDGTSIIDYIKGKIKALFHYKLDAAQTDKNLTLQGNLDVGGTDITDLAEIQTAEVDMPATWTYQGDGVFDPVSLPTHRYSDLATTSSMNQELQVLFSGAFAPGAASIDDLILLPIDNGYATVPSDDNQYLIFDSQSNMPSVLVSTDGDIDKAVYLASGTMRQPFSIDPKNGSNFAILNIWADSAGDQYGQFLAEVTIKYQPRYLLVAT